MTLGAKGGDSMSRVARDYGLGKEVVGWAAGPRLGPSWAGGIDKSDSDSDICTT